MENLKKDQSPEYKTVKTVGTSPLTWAPITIAFAIACLLPVPWWVGTIAVAAAFAGVLAIWKGRVAKLFEIFKAQEAFNKRASAEQQEKDMLTHLRYKGFDAASENLEASIAIGKKIQDLLIENRWLDSTYSYGVTTYTLIDEMRRKAQGIVDGSSEGKSTEDRRRRENFAAERKTLEETFENIQQILRGQPAEDTSTESPAEKLRRANEISRRAREEAKRAIDDQHQNS